MTADNAYIGLSRNRIVAVTLSEVASPVGAIVGHERAGYTLRRPRVDCPRACQNAARAAAVRQCEGDHYGVARHRSRRNDVEFGVVVAVRAAEYAAGLVEHHLQ